MEELKVDHTIIIVTHNLQQAARISDFAAFMYLGQLVEFDAARRMFVSPKDPHTQNFIMGRSAEALFGEGSAMRRRFGSALLVGEVAAVS